MRPDPYDPYDPYVIRRRMVVSGYVQGVFFRQTCRQVAVRLGLSGWVRNLPAGTVEVVAEGAPERVDRLVGWARRGPDGADVARVEVYDEEPQGLVGFEIRPTPC